MKTVEEEMAEGIYPCGAVKMSHKGFCLATLEHLMKDWLLGSYLVLKITPIFPGDIPLITIGCKYNYRNVLEFITREGG